MRDRLNVPASGESSLSFRLESEPHELAALYHDEDHFVFLDSSRVGSDQGRFSTLAWSPEAVFRSKGFRIDIRRSGLWRRVAGDPMEELQRLLSERDDSADGELAGGAIGYLGYDLFRVFEHYDGLSSVDDLALPDSCLAFFDTILVFDHDRKSWSVTGRNPELFETKIREILARVQSPRPPADFSAPASAGIRSESNMSREQYLRSVERVLDHIAAGDIYQLNLSQRFSRPLTVAPFDVFTTLRGVSPSFYGAYLNCGDHIVISSSPELFLRRRGDMIETRPIKGTRPRGRTPEEDRAFESELLDSEKEKAELAMIVDLERNDLGRICAYGAVEVSDRRYIDRLPTLLHTVAAVRGRLRPDVTAVDILRATFPGGSISGCPKIRAIEIIDSLEPNWRHVYTGAIGFIGFNGEMILNIAIRTLLATGGRIYYQVGGGIVADSIPDAEFSETLQKAAAIETAIATAESSHRTGRAAR
ncbi:MAG TPA: aminodeoxychorismate synthase component I [Terriglobia bacterium]|nr:aminodeoxychorismate synthase component I [Terriglobia bacterium]